MGVTGLWKLIEPSGKPVPLETLENKVLAVDISIWLHQVVKGFQDNKGNTLAHAHLLGLFHRLCKLLYYRIKPVFVFDGGVPQLKRETIAKRSQSKNKILTEADRLQALLLQTLAKEKVVQQALGSNTDDIFKSPTKPKPPTLQKPDKDDIFKLPDLPNDQKPTKFDAPTTSYSTTDISTDSDSSLDDKNLRLAYAHNLQAVDVTSSQFKSLPADIRHEILTDIKETRKQSSWGRLHELPTQSDEFSAFQMKRLLKRRQVQVCLEEAEKQMEGKSLTLNELRTFLSEEGVITAASTAAAGTSKQIASDENTRFLLVRDLKKAIESAAIKEEEELQNSQNSQDGKKPKIKTENFKMEKDDDEDSGEEYDEDMQKAIKMSLECTNDPVYDDKDYECDEVKMNREQKKLLKDAAESLAKAYLIEYAGMNEDEIKEMLEQSQRSQNEDDDLSFSLNFKYNDKFIIKGEMCTPYKKMKTPVGNLSKMSTDATEEEYENEIGKKKDDEKQLERKFEDIEFVSDSDDSDLVEVAEKEDPSPVKLNLSTELEKKSEKNLQITVDLTQKFDKNDDIFADVFENVNGKVENVEKTSENKPQSLQDESEQIIKRNDNIERKKAKIIKADVQIKSTPRDILFKLKEDLKNVSQITLDDIEITKAEDDIEMKDESICDKLPEEEIQKSDSQAKDILDSLKVQMSEVQKITLDDIKIDTKPESNTDSETKISEKLAEIIEIPDDDLDVNNVNKTPSKQKTPLKQETISAYFETEYKIKRTPDKAKEDEDDLQTTPKVKKPFFIRKTPGASDRKRQSDNDISGDEDTPSKRGKKVSKTLFGDDTKNENKIIQNEDSIKPIENAFEAAAKVLKENKTEEELQSIATDIAKQKRELELERNRQDRMGTSITDKMSYECMQLLKLFGVPYIVAPMEAEAQCAFLNSINLTDGTITDDSDIWLFGGKTVYKNFFNQQKHVLEFRVENIEKLFNVDRKKLIQLAILVGSDYTTGISGIGTVTALEILATFPPTPIKDGETSEIVSVISSLRKFREWWRNGKSIGPTGRTALRSKLKNIELLEGFPNLQVIEAYLNPKVDVSRENFSWGMPDVETLREFTKKNFGWTKAKTDEILQPVLKKLNEKKIQSSIRNYFTVKSALAVRELKVSKRVQKAIDKLSATDSQPHHSSETEDDQAPKPKKSRVRKQQTARSDKTAKSTSEKESKSTEMEENCSAESKMKKRRQNIRTKKNIKNSNNEEEDVADETAASTSTSIVKSKSKPKLSKLLPSEAPEVIPQREKDAEEMQKRKEKAAEVLKKFKENKKGTKNILK